MFSSKISRFIDYYLKFSWFTWHVKTLRRDLHLSSAHLASSWCELPLLLQTCSIYSTRVSGPVCSCKIWAQCSFTEHVFLQTSVAIFSRAFSVFLAADFRPEQNKFCIIRGVTHCWRAQQNKLCFGIVVIDKVTLSELRSHDETARTVTRVCLQPRKKRWLDFVKKTKKTKKKTFILWEKDIKSVLWRFSSQGQWDMKVDTLEQFLWLQISSPFYVTQKQIYKKAPYIWERSHAGHFWKTEKTHAFYPHWLPTASHIFNRSL